MMLKWWLIEIFCLFSFYLCLKGKDLIVLYGKWNLEFDWIFLGLIKFFDGKLVMIGGVFRRSWRGEVC